VGGKALGLGRLLGEGLPVPSGFVIGTTAYRQHLEQGDLGPAIAALLSGALEDDDELRSASERIGQLLVDTPLPATISGEVVAAYDRLGVGPVAVRSSAAAEDSASFSFAGQQETYLWVSGADEVVRHVVRCWASLFSPQAIRYRARLEHGGDFAQHAMAVVVQEMVPAVAAGVMMTIDPVTGDRSQISIESSYGLGVAVVGGEVTPDRYCVDKVTLDLRSQTLGHKHLAYRFDPQCSEVRPEAVAPEDQEASSLSRQEVVALATLGKRIERALGAPQDIEWAVAPGPDGARAIHLLQCRPETVWSQRAQPPVSRPGASVMDELLGTIIGSRSRDETR
jgi:pyruvate,water dikinase